MSFCVCACVCVCTCVSVCLCVMYNADTHFITLRSLYMLKIIDVYCYEKGVSKKKERKIERKKTMLLKSSSCGGYSYAELFLFPLRAH